MKKIYFLAILLSAMLCGCNEKEPIYGGFMFRSIYVVDGDDVVDAQNYNVDFPKGGGSVSLSIVGPGQQIGSIGGADWLSVEKDGEPEVYVSDAEELSVGTWYVQKMLFSVKPNTSGKARTTSLRVVSLIYNGFAADFVIRQE